MIPACGSVHLPNTYDVRHEQIRRVPLSAVEATRNGARATLHLLRVVPVVESGKRVGTVTEKATIVLVLQSGF